MLRTWLGVFLLIGTIPLAARAWVWEIGGQTGYQTCPDEVYACESDLLQIDFRPHLAMYLNEHLTAGISLGVKSRSTQEYDTFEYMVGPQVGYYFRKAGPGYPFLTGRAVAGLRNYDYPGSFSFNDGVGLVSVGGGYIYLLDKTVGLTGAVMVEQLFLDSWTGFHTDTSIAGLLGLRVLVY